MFEYSGATHFSEPRNPGSLFYCYPHDPAIDLNTMDIRMGLPRHCHWYGKNKNLRGQVQKWLNFSSSLQWLFSSPMLYSDDKGFTNIIPVLSWSLKALYHLRKRSTASQADSHHHFTAFTVFSAPVLFLASPSTASLVATLTQLISNVRLMAR